MRMSGELEIHAISCHLVSIIGFVRQKNGGFIFGHDVQRLIQIGSPAHNVIHASEPEPRTILLDRRGLVRQDLYSTSLKSSRYLPALAALNLLPISRPN